jgi:hypothetical protein
VIVLQNFAQTSGAAGRAAEQAALAKRFATDADGLKAALAAMPVETSAILGFRIAFVAICFCALAYWAYYEAQLPQDVKDKAREKAKAKGKEKTKDDTVILEPLVVTGVFAAWAVSSPGTVLAAFLNAEALAGRTMFIAFVAAALLLTLSNTHLKKAKKKE